MLARLLVAVFLLLPLAADAGEIVQQVPVPPRVFFSDVVTGPENETLPVELTSPFESFNPSLGMLTEVHFAYDYRLRLTVHVGSNGGGGHGLFSGLFAIDSENYDGESYFWGDGSGAGGGGGSTGEKIFEFSMTGETEVDPNEVPLLAFLGPPDEVAVVLEADAEVLSAGDATVTLELLDGSSVTLRYVYVPEPDAERAALAAGAALLLARSRSGRARAARRLGRVRAG